MSGSPEIDREQAYADMLFSRLDAEVAAAQAEAARAMVLAYCPPSVAAHWGA